ncbi:hydrogenase formation protein HypD [cyanobacterium TDX16]|nr:hydrogenase formation protein HypD [cyanobacterium TDX16]
MTQSISTLIEQVTSLAQLIGRPVNYMEVCGTHTVSLFRSGVRSMLPVGLKLVSGPGCPVCVTAQRHIDAAIELATNKQVIIATYGDMLRVPGRRGSLERLRAEGARVEIVNSASSALSLARSHSADEVVFLAVGFETTAPATAVVVQEADRAKVDNFSVLMCHKRVVPAMLALLADGKSALDGFLCPGHVSVIIGSAAYQPVVTKHNAPCVVAGFEPLQMLMGIRRLLQQTLDGQARLENVYPACVSSAGNTAAQMLMRKVFRVEDAPWRALGTIRGSGFALAPRFAQFDAMSRFGIILGADADHPDCRCGEVIQGRAEPADCPLFDRACTPMSPVGPCMVSSEGTCAAWHRYQRSSPHQRQNQRREFVSCPR